MVKSPESFLLDVEDFLGVRYADQKPVIEMLKLNRYIRFCPRPGHDGSGLPDIDPSPRPGTRRITLARDR